MMTHIEWLLHKIFRVTFVTSHVLSLTLSVTQIALAQYQPPPDQKPPSGYSDSSGVRGRCEASNGKKLKLLAPITHVGKTTSLHPTFAWFVPDDKPRLIEFSLYEFDNNFQPKKLNIYTRKLSTLPGIMKLSLPQNSPGLKVGKRYLWQLQTLCDNNRPSRNPFIRAEIEVVPAPETFLTASFTSQKPSVKANLYAQAGLWYDALSEILGHNTDGEFFMLVAGLLTDLAKLEQSQYTRYLTDITISHEKSSNN